MDTSREPEPAGAAAHSGRDSVSSLQPREGRVALVSGAGSGLGLQIVRSLAERGMRVVLGSRSVDRGRVALERLGGLASLVAVRQLDITDAESVTQLASWVGGRLGRCDVLMNNAAVLVDDDMAAATADLGAVRHALETNLLGTWRLTQAIVPLMRACRYGRVVNISSELGSLTSMGRGLPAYRVSKSAVNALTRVLADELADYGILVNACCPGVGRVERQDGHRGPSLPASADTPVWLATLPDDGPTGGFYRERARIDW